MYRNKTIMISYAITGAMMLAAKLYTNKLVSESILAHKRLAQERAKSDQSMKNLGK